MENGTIVVSKRRVSRSWLNEVGTFAGPWMLQMILQGLQTLGSKIGVPSSFSATLIRPGFPDDWVWAELTEWKSHGRTEEGEVVFYKMFGTVPKPLAVWKLVWRAYGVLPPEYPSHIELRSKNWLTGPTVQERDKFTDFLIEAFWAFGNAARGMMASLDAGQHELWRTKEVAAFAGPDALRPEKQQFHKLQSDPSKWVYVGATVELQVFETLRSGVQVFVERTDEIPEPKQPFRVALVETGRAELCAVGQMLVARLSENRRLIHVDGSEVG